MSIITGPETRGRSARLVVDVPTGDVPVAGVVLILHGGRSTSTAPTSRRQLAALRMLPFAGAVRRAAAATDDHLVVARLQYRVRGWNGRQRDPVIDARWALHVLRDRFGDVPIGLIGHSMGGRTAMAVAGEPGVVGVVGLAPWLGAEDGVGRVAGRRLLIMHGTADRMTDPAGSRSWADRARRHAAAVTYVAVAGGKHAMLHEPRRWHRLAAEFTVATILAHHAGTAATRQDVGTLGTGCPDVAKLLPEALAGAPSAQA